VKINAEVFERAQAVIDQLSVEYRSRAQDDLENLYLEMELAQTEASERPTHLENVRAVLHDMRGQGGTFGLPLITQIAKSLGTYLKSEEAAENPRFEIAQAHIEALRHVLAENISDQNSERGRQIIDDLRTSTGMAVEP
jgi:HPt (histidine-containing phosphotransfer) domain-containing protein